MSDETIFASAIGLPPEERAGFLDDACGGDAELRQRVEALLRCHDEPGSFLTGSAEEDFDATIDFTAEEQARLSARATELRSSQAEDQSSKQHEVRNLSLREDEDGTHVLYFGDYELQGEIARGAMGVVYRAEQKSLKRTVAIKMIRSTLLSNAADVSRFRAEAEAAASLDHPNIVPIYEVGVHEEQHYFSMKLIEGGTLRDRLEEMRKHPKAAARLMSKVAGAIHTAHQHGILHRDLKPGNILIDEEVEPHVTDFGLAKQMESNSSVTLSGQIMGTPQYMAPEQAEGGGKELTTGADVYALGAIFYEMLCGEPPHKGESLMETLKLVAEVEPELPSRRNPEVDRDLQTIAMKCLEKDPAKRYSSAQGLRNDLDHWLRGEPILARPVGTAEKIFKWVKRKPVHAAAAAIAVLFFLTVGIGGSITALQQARLKLETDRTLTDLRRTAPVFFEQARMELEDGEFDEAFDKIGFAIQLDDESADYRLFQANLLQATEKLAAAAEDYRRVIELRPQDESAQVNLALCEKLLLESGGGELQRDQQWQLLAALREQKRLVEADPLAAIVMPEIEAGRALLEATLREAGKTAGWTDEEVAIIPDGSLSVVLYGEGEMDFSALQGHPVSALDLKFAGVEDLSSMVGLRLKELNLRDTKVSDLSPLRGMPLERLTLNRTRCRDISALEGMELTYLTLTGTEVEDLGPLDGMPLVELFLVGCKSVKDLSPLRGTPLQNLDLNATSLTDLTPLQDCPALERLRINATPIKDISALRGLPLRILDAQKSSVVDITPLRGTETLESIRLSNGVQDLSPLRELPRLELIGIADGNNRVEMKHAEVFWKEYDANLAARREWEDRWARGIADADAEGWEDCLARLTVEEVAENGNGWLLKEGELVSPERNVEKGVAMLPVAGLLSNTSYQVSVKLRRTEGNQAFHLVLPVGKSMTGFDLDGSSGQYTGLVLVDGKAGKNLPETVAGRQINDSDLHHLVLTVLLVTDTATIIATLDGQPLFRWTGSTSSLSRHDTWIRSEREFLSVASLDEGWVVSELKVKRRERLDYESTSQN